MPTSTTAAPGLTMSGVTRPGLADRRDEDVRAPRVRRQVGGARVADRDGRVLGEEEHRHRLPDDLAPPEDDGLAPLELDAVLREHPP